MGREHDMQEYALYHRGAGGGNENMLSMASHSDLSQRNVISLVKSFILNFIQRPPNKENLSNSIPSENVHHIYSLT